MKQNRQIATWMGAVLATLCALLVVAAPGHAADSQGKLTAEFHQTYPLAAGGRVDLDNINGSVHITAWDRDEVKVDAVKSANKQQRLDEAKIVVEAESGQIRIYTKYPGHDHTFDSDGDDNPASVEYTLMVPKTARLDSIKLINGALDLQGVEGEVRASCINGRLTAHLAGGSTRLSTINGQLDAQFDRLGDSSLELSSVNGSLNVTIPSDSKAELGVSTIHGGIHNDFGLHVNDGQFVGHSLRAELAGGGTQIKLSNINGGIDIHHANDGRALSPAKNLDHGNKDDGEI